MPRVLSTPTAQSTTHSTTQSSTRDDSEEEFYDWPLTDDDELSKAADCASSQTSMPPPETPRKAIKTDMLSTPGKRTFEEMNDGNSGAWPTPISARKSDDIFTTPATNGKDLNLFLSPSTPQDTPTPVRYKDVHSMNGSDSSLTSEILSKLEEAKISLPPNVRDDINSICSKHSLYTYGVIKGRDVSRSLIAKKDAKIVELQASIEALQAERETSRAVIRNLRREVGNTRLNGN